MKKKEKYVGGTSFEADLRMSEELFRKIAEGYEPTHDERGWFINVGKGYPPEGFDHCQWLLSQLKNYQTSREVLDFLVTVFGTYDPVRDEERTQYSHLHFNGFEKLRKTVHQLQEKLPPQAK